MKYLVDISDLEPLKERIAKAKDFIDSNSLGAINLCLFRKEKTAPVLKVWNAPESVFDASPMRVQAFGSFSSGEMLITELADKNIGFTLFGKGNKLKGKALFIQRIDTVYNIVYNNDTDDDKHFFRMTATTDSEIMEILLKFALDCFPEVNPTEVNNAMHLLIGDTGGDGDGR